MGTRSLDDLLVAAGEAPPDRRILLRDEIAAYGVAAIERLVEPVWSEDPKYIGFAVRTIAKCGEFGARNEALATLRRLTDRLPPGVLRDDAAAAILDLGGGRVQKRSKPTAPRSWDRAGSMTVEDLTEGRCYRRRDLHEAGLGGNRQTGISYPSGGAYCLLFSDPTKATEYGYRDAPSGEDGYLYYGRWDGPGDMTLTGGNQAVLDRSPELYLFTAASCGHRFRGRFECFEWHWEQTVRDGKELRAIVFKLRRAFGA